MNDTFKQSIIIGESSMTDPIKIHMAFVVNEAYMYKQN